MHIWFDSDSEDERTVDQPAITATGRRTGPCYHCASTNSSQWRRGPAEKPVLCNACGLRYGRTGSEHKPLNRAAAADVLLQLSTSVLSDDATDVIPVQKRPRGRPRKVKLPAAVMSDEVTDVHQVPKRGPGRPRKIKLPAAELSDVVTDVRPVLKRPRGRPRKIKLLAVCDE